MAPKRTITINGRVYDAVTGLPVKTPQPTPKVGPVPKKPTSKTVPQTRGQAAAGAVHSSMQRSITLARRAAKKPVASVNKIVRRPQPGRAMDIAPTKNLSKFAPHPVVKPTEKPDKPAQVHPAAERAIAKAQVKKQAQIKAATPPTSKEIKEAAIAKAMTTPKPKAKKAPKNKWTRRVLIIAAIIVVIVSALYLVYRFIPSVSVSIAAAQAGVDARYPDYVPDGFSLKQPVTYSDGQVDLTFISNSNPTAYTISQKRSSWDSSAVLDKVVEPVVGDNYATSQERGLTIYTYSKGAAWVNGGILYEITSDANLSNDQVRHIATSL